MKFVDSVPLKWGEIAWGGPVPDSVGEHAQEPKEKKKFEGHGAPDKRTDLIKRFQDAFGRDQ